MDKFNRQMPLSKLISAKELYLTAINVRTKGAKNDTDDPKAHFPKKEYVYTEQSNSIFYYNDYRVLLLLDFSQSTTAVYPTLSNSYMLKMQRSIEAVLNNLIFELPNKLRKEKKQSTHEATPKGQFGQLSKLRRIQSVGKELTQTRMSKGESEDSGKELLIGQLTFSAIEEQSESGIASGIASTTPGQRIKQSSKFATLKKNFGALSQSEVDAAEPNISQEFKKKEPQKKPEETAVFAPRIYLSIVISGLPPDDSLQLIVQNIKLDKNNLNDLMKTINYRLSTIEHTLRKQISRKQQSDDPESQGSLQAHLYNAQYVLDLMNQDAKPLLVFFTDSTNSLLQLRQASKPVTGSRPKDQLKKSQLSFGRKWADSGQLDAHIHKLHLNDAQIMSIDLQEQNRICNNFGYLAHESSLKYWTLITQGVNFTFSQLMAIYERQQEQGMFAREKGRKGKKGDKTNALSLADQMIVRGSSCHFAIDGKSLVIQDRQPQIPKANEADLFRSASVDCKPFVQQEQSINPLQKLMYGRACNYRKFRQSDEIRNFLADDFNDPRHQMMAYASKYPQSDVNLSELLLNNKFCPLLQSESLAEYVIKDVNFTSILEFRSRMGFKFLSFEYDFVRQSESPKFGQMTTGEGETVKPQSLNKVIKSVEYQYWIDTFNFITCTLTVIPNSNKEQSKASKKHKSAVQVLPNQNSVSNQSTILVKYMIYAPKDTLQTIRKSANNPSRRTNENPEDSLYKRVSALVMSIYKKDNNFCLLDSICIQLQKTAVLFNQGPSTSKDKYKIVQHSKLTSKQLPNSQFQDEQREIFKSKAADQSQLTPPPEKKKKAKKTSLIIQKPEQAKAFLHENRKVWDQLAVVMGSQKQIYQWKVYFRYQMIAIVTNSNRKVPESKQTGSCDGKDSNLMKFVDPNIEEVWQQDQKIETKIFHAISQFTTLTLDRSTFVQVFHENLPQNLYARLREQFFRSNTKLTEPDPQANLPQSDLSFSYCLIRLNWVSANIAECHFGFYQVNPKQRMHFLKAFQQHISQCKHSQERGQLRQRYKSSFLRDNKIRQDDSKGSLIIPDPFGKKEVLANEDGIGFQCFQKNITSLLLRPTQTRISRQIARLKQTELDQVDESDEEKSPIKPLNQSIFRKNAGQKEEKEAEEQEESQESEDSADDEKDTFFQEKSAVPVKFEAKLPDKSPVAIDKKPLEMLLFNDTRRAKPQTKSELERLRLRFSKFGLNVDRAEIFYVQSWEWVNQNINISLQFFQRVLNQRLKDGFVMVNRYNETSDYYHLFKVMKAEKDPRPIKKEKKDKVKPDLTKLLDLPKKKVENVDIMLQYLIYVEMRHVDESGNLVKYQPGKQRQTVSVVRAELYMERETCFFHVNRKPEKNVPTVHKKGERSQTSSFQAGRSQGNSFKGGNENESKTSQKQTNQSESDHSNVKFVNSKDFFEMVADYLSKVDEFLKSNIFAYHQIVKNSMLKQIQSNNLVLQGKERKLTTELCYFRNINARTRRQRRQLENLIREKMSFIYKDWSCYLKQQYPELFVEPQMMLENAGKKPKDSDAKIGFRPVEVAHDKGLIENQFDNLKIEQLVENSKQIAVQNLHMPMVQKGLTSHEIASMRKLFQNKLAKVFESFYDFKISCDKYAYLKANRRADFYCKLISKQILLLVEVPTSELVSELIEAQGFIEVKYRRFDLTMINMDNLAGAIELQQRLGLGLVTKKIVEKKVSIQSYARFFRHEEDSRKVEESPITQMSLGKNRQFRGGSTQRYNDYRSQPNLLQSQLTVTPLDGWEQQKSPKNMLAAYPKNHTNDDSDGAAEVKSGESETVKLKEAQESDESSNRNQTSIYFNEEFDSDQEVDQIDQDEVYRAYFDFFFRYGRQDQDLEFEQKVNRIVRNFVNYIQTSYEKIFAQVVLMSFQQRRQNEEFATQEFRKERLLSSTSDRSKGTSDLREFTKAKKAMGCVAFKLDLNFAFVIYSQLASIDDRKRFIELIEAATDQSFKAIIERNFFKCISNETSYLFKENEADAVVSAKRSKQTTLNPTKSETVKEHIGQNLQETPDAYSDSDDETKSTKRQETTKKLEIKKMYASCRKLLLEIRAIIKDADGKILDSRPLNKFSELFQLAFTFKDRLIPALVEKAKAQEMSNRLLNYDRFNTADGSKQDQEVVEIPDNDVSVELETRFYTVAKYIGLVGQSEIDLFSETQQPLLVNQDKQEDLINACHLFSLQKDFQSVSGLIFKQPLFRQLKKTQIIKVIPTVFKHENQSKQLESEPDSDFMTQGEHRVFQFNDIQRRTIYGFLRRMYAVIGENVLELLTLKRRQEKLSIQLAQKYFGYLLHYQRVTHRVELFDAKDLKRFKNLPLEVGNELRKSSILQTGFITRDSSTKVDDFHNTVYYLSMPKDNVYGLSRNWDQSDGPSVPFWGMFAVECNANYGIFMNFVIYVPQTKQEENVFGVRTVVKHLNDSTAQIRLKVKKVILLQDVLAKNKLSHELKLADPPKQFKAILESFEEERRRKADEDMRKQREQDEKKRSEQSQQLSMPQKQTVSKPASKIGQRFKKMNTMATSAIDQASSDQATHTQSIASNIIESMQNTSVLSTLAAAQSYKITEQQDLRSPVLVHVTSESSAVESQDSSKYCVLENFPKAMRVFETSHRLSGQDALAKIAVTLGNYSIEGQPNVYVFQNDKVINLMRISYLGTKMTEDEMEAARLQNLPTVRETERLLVEIQGIEEPKIDQRRFMCHEIQRTITEETMKNISSAVFKNDKKLSKEDISYIKDSESKFLLLYPIDARLYDKLALLKYFKQSATRRFLMEIELQTNQMRTRRVDKIESKSAADDDQIKRSTFNKPIILPEQADPTGQDGHYVQWNSQDNQLLFNFKNSFKDEKQIILGTFLGDSLALVNFSMLDEKFDRAVLDEQIRAKADHQKVLELMDSFQQTSFQVEPSAFEQTIQELTSQQNMCFGYRHDESAGQSALDQFSIPSVFHTLGEQEEGSTKSFKPFDENRFGIDKRLAAPEKGVYWMQMQVSVQGQLKHDLFINNLTLTLNQSIYDCMIELYLDKQFISRRIPIETRDRADGFKLKLNALPSDHTYQEQPKKQQLTQLFDSSLACHSPISERFTSPLKGVVSEINQSFSFTLLKNLHRFLREEVANEMQTKLAQAMDPISTHAIINQMVSLVLVIVWIDQCNKLPARVIAFKYSLDADFQTRRHYEDIQKFLRAEQTTLRGIEVHFTTVLGSFPIALTLGSLGVFVPFDCSKAAFECYDLSSEQRFVSRVQTIARSPETKRSLLVHQDLHLTNSFSPGLGSNSQFSSPSRHHSVKSPQIYISNEDPEQMKHQRQAVITEALQVFNKLKRFNQIETKTQVFSPALLEQLKLDMPSQGQTFPDDASTPDKVVYSRNFFLVINFGKSSYNNGSDLATSAKSRQENEFVMDCFNLCKDKFDDLTSIIQNLILWVDNRQDCLRRIVSQKLGTLYTLPQFYESQKIIKTTGNLKQVYNAQNIYFTQQIPLRAQPTTEKPEAVKRKESIRLSPSKSLRKSKAPIDLSPAVTDPAKLTKQEAKQAKELRRLQRKQRREERKREAIVLEQPTQPAHFDPSQVFKKYFEDLFSNEPKLKTLNFIRDQGSQEIPRPQVPQRPGMRTPLQAASFVQDPQQILHQRAGSPHLKNPSFVSKGVPKANASFSSTRPQVNETKRNAVKFKDLIGYKIQTTDWTDDQQLTLSDMYLIAPAMQPSILNDIQNLIHQRSHKKETSGRRHKALNVPTDGESLIPSIHDSITHKFQSEEWVGNHTLVKNPLLFHGLQARRNLKYIFGQLENVQKLAVIIKQANDNNDTDIEKLLKRSEKDKQLKDILERMALGMKKNNHDLHQNALGLLLEKSRLAYSGVTIKLFNRIAEGVLPVTKLGQRTETIVEDDEYSISRRTSEVSDQRNKRSFTESEKVTDQVSIQMISQFFEKFTEEQFRREFQIKKLYTPTPHQLRIIKEITCGEKKAKTMTNLREARLGNLHKSSNVNQLRWTMNDKPRELNHSQRSLRSQHSAEEQLLKSSDSKAFADLVGQSSNLNKGQDLRMSQIATPQTTNIFGYQNVEPQTSKLLTNSLTLDNLKQGNSLENLVKFAIKSANNNQIVLYVIQIVRRQLQFQCLVFEDVFGSIPVEIQSYLQIEALGTLGTNFVPDLNLIVPIESLKRSCSPCSRLTDEQISTIEANSKKKLELIRISTENQLMMTTMFKTHSFCYDFHLSSILRQVQQSTLLHTTNQQLNLSKSLHYLVSSFQQFPTNASNFIKEFKLRITIGQINPQLFLHYFGTQVEALGYTKANLRPSSQRVFQEKTSTFPFATESGTEDNLAFYLKNKAHEQTHLSSASQKSPKPKKLSMPLSQHQSSRLDDQLFNYHRLFIVERLDPQLHGTIEKFENNEKRSTANDASKSQGVVKPQTRIGQGYFTSSTSNMTFQTSFHQPHYELSKAEKQVLSNYKKSLPKPFEHSRTIKCNQDASAQNQMNADQPTDNNIEFVIYVLYVKDSAPQVTLTADEKARFMQKRMDSDISMFSEGLLEKIEACIQDFERESAWQQFYIQSQRETEIHKDIVKKLLLLSWKINIQDVSDRLKSLLAVKKFDADKLLNEFDTALKGQTYHFQEANISRYTHLKRMVICPQGKQQRDRQPPQFLLDLTADSTAMQVRIELVRRQIKSSPKDSKADATKIGKSPDAKPQMKNVILSPEEKKLIDQVAAVMTNYLWLKACI